jgi:hypothetical protein
MRLLDRTLCSHVALCALSGALLLSRGALASPVLPAAATPDQKKQAMDHFAAGKQAIESKNWERAAMELRASLDVVDSPNARLELARALRDSTKFGEAWVEYGRVIETATKLAATEDRYAKTADAATTERAAIEDKLAFVIANAPSAPAGATLKVGGRDVPPEQWAAPVVATPGAVDVVLSDSSGKEIARKTVSVQVGQRTPVNLDANPAPAAAPPPPAAVSDEDKPPGTATDEPKPAEAPPPPPSNMTKLRPFAYVAGGVGVAGLATFAIFGLMSNSTFNDLKSACPPSNGGCPASSGKSGEISSGQTQQTVANVGLTLGLVGLAAGATLFVLSMPPKSSAANAALYIGPGTIGVKGTL